MVSLIKSDITEPLQNIGMHIVQQICLKIRVHYLRSHWSAAGHLPDGKRQTSHRKGCLYTSLLHKVWEVWTALWCWSMWSRDLGCTGGTASSSNAVMCIKSFIDFPHLVTGIKFIPQFKAKFLVLSVFKSHLASPVVKRRKIIRGIHRVLQINFSGFFLFSFEINSFQSIF